MNLQNRLLLIVMFGFTGLVFTVLIFARTAVDRAFSELEHNSIREAAEAAAGRYKDELAGLTHGALERASDARLVERLKAALGDPLEDGSFDEDFAKGGIDVVAVTNATGEKILGTRCLDRTSGKPLPVPKDVASFFVQDSFLRVHYQALSRKAGLVVLPEGPMLVASVPALPADEEAGLIRGTLIAGRLWSEAEFLAGAEAGGLSVYHQAVGRNMGDDFAAARMQLSQGERVYVSTPARGLIAAYLMLDDVYGQPAVVVRFMRPRLGYMQAFGASWRLAVFALVAGGAFLLAIFLLTEATILGRMRQLLRELSAIQSLEHISVAKITIRGRDEIGRIAEGVRYVLSALRVNRFRWLRAERQLQRVLAATPAGIIFVDRGSNTVRRVNGAAMTMLGGEQGGLIDMPTDKLIHSIAGSADMESIAAHFTNDSEALPAVLCGVDGRKHAVLLNGSEIKIDQARSLVLSFVPAAADVSRVSRGRSEVPSPQAP